jgi:uncharacterized protein YjbJ (UPF0337 family)
MDENKVEGAFRQATGRVQDAVGGLAGDATTQARGKVNEIAGSAQRNMGEVIDTVRNATVEQPLIALAVAGGVGYLLGLIMRRS